MAKRSFVCLFLICYVNCILAQEQEINIQIEIVTVTYDGRGVNSLSENTIPDPIYRPVAITFHCSVANKSKKEYFLFESNPVAFFRDEDFSKAYKYDTMGYFYLINEKDSVLLFNYRSGSAFKKEEFGISPSADVFSGDSSFRPFLSKFTSTDKEESKSRVYAYLKNSKLVYIPIVSDYEKILNRTSVYNRDEIVYPKEAIEVKMPNPFDLTFSVEFDDENFEVYPAKYRTIDYLFSTE